MTRVITYGTFDLFHEGHRRLLERAKALGDELIVAVTSSEFDVARGKLNVRQSVVDRIANVQNSGYADRIILEEHEGQKVTDIQQYGVDIFAVGSDWLGEFDYLRDYCQVVYLERTRGVSSTDLRNKDGLVRVGIAGSGRIAARMVAEARLVSGVSLEGVFSRAFSHAQAFADEHELATAFDDFDAMCSAVNAVYIATPHGTHAQYTRRALAAGCHVLCEKPLALAGAEAEDLFHRATEGELVLLEAVKTAFAPAFLRLVALAHSGIIGTVRSVDATFTKLIASGRELQAPDGGSISELATYPLLAAVKILGHEPTDVHTVSIVPPGSDVEVFSRIDLTYAHTVASARTGIGVKAQGDLIVAGTKGYIWVPAPWWLTEYFEVRFEDQGQNRRFFARFDGDGLRYELAEFANMIHDRRLESYQLRPSESIALARIIERARSSATILQ